MTARPRCDLSIAEGVQETGSESYNPVGGGVPMALSPLARRYETNVSEGSSDRSAYEGSIAAAARVDTIYANHQ